MKHKEETGNKYGKLTVISMVRIENRNPIYWKCKCDCGNETIVSGSTLRCGKSKSCGCNTNQSNLLKFKKENPNATYEEIVRERIKAHTKKQGKCLVWTATVNKQGYGVFVYNKKTVNASRASWISTYGEIPKELCVCHSCDNPRCVNPSCLFLSTYKGNTLDMVQKGRDRWQTTRKFPIGTKEKIAELRSKGKMYREIAKELNLTLDQVKSQLQSFKRSIYSQHST